MARDSSLSIKEKWALEAQLGEMLRGIDSSSRDQKFVSRLNDLVEEFSISALDVVEIALSMQERQTAEIA
ncbi:hypothetical protein [Carnimonas bestiolae]|uniref:hypothetical protein n=1 Tax=Carnimonas bestiolae TaxID=3402172 RepID=UPI003EDC2E47